MPSFTRSALVMGALSAFGAAQKTDAACDDVVVFMARGNNAPYQPDGRTFTYFQTLCSKLAPESCDYIDIVFDATLGADYCTQINEGRTNGVREITAFHQKCPNSQIVINGYSEGANVVGDILGGPGICPGNSPSLDPNSAAGQAVAAALIWGDVQHTANQPYNVLDGSDKGPAPRTGNALALLNRWSSVLRSYCAAGDPVCAGGSDVAQHLDYFEIYTGQATDWTIEMLKKKQPVSSSSSSATPTPTASVSASAAPTTLQTAIKPSSTGISIPTYGGGDEGVVPYPTKGAGSSSTGLVPTPSPSAINACPVVYEYVTVY